MTDASVNVEQRDRRRWGAAAISALVGLLLLASAGGYFLYFPSRLGPEQPIAFSHRVHVTDKKISCVVCHPGAIKTAKATVPPLETCLLCHERIIIHHPQIVKLRKHFDRGEPVEWARVNALPDYVQFHHGVHVNAGFDCGRCHGNVARMDRVWLANKFTMGYCIQCHRDEDGSTDCLACHR